MVGPSQMGGQSKAVPPSTDVSDRTVSVSHRFSGSTRSFDSTAPAGTPDGRRIVVHPFLGPEEGLDITDALVAALATELDRAYGGNETLNRLEAERLLLEVI